MEHPDVTVNMGAMGRELTIDEKVRLDAWVTASMRAREFAWLEYESGNVDEWQWKAEEGVVRIILRSERTRAASFK